MSKKSFGRMPEGQEVDLFTLKSEKLEAQISSYGAAIIVLRAPDRSGNWEDIVIGPQDLSSHVANQRSNGPIFFGASIGRYANRIAHGVFSLDGKTDTLAKNDGDNSLHGGPGGFHNVVWQSEAIANGVAFHYLSKDGEEGYPGNLSVTVRYTVVGADLRIAYQATTDKPTVLNLTNHAYFNMAGAGRGTVLAHQLKLFASRFTPCDAHLIPTGEIRSVAGTPLDFRKSTTVGDRIDADDEFIRLAHGYDHNFVMDEQGAKLKQAAEMYEPLTGRVMEVWTTEPAIQFYTGNFLDGTFKGKNGVACGRREGFCLETQHYPDSPNHPEFPSTVLRPGQSFQSETIYRFSAR
ncbi:MAG TPA: aldose epimerase family protein [Candidatus Acidoferrum sp.]|nr:aldose epimerase family protein [Candidatus Acidoferrum sp.]